MGSVQGELDDYELEYAFFLEELDFKDWTSEDFAIILANEFEDRNLHSMTEFPMQLLEKLVESGVDEEKRKQFMKNLASDYLE